MAGRVTQRWADRWDNAGLTARRTKDSCNGQAVGGPLQWTSGGCTATTDKRWEYRYNGPAVVKTGAMDKRWVDRYNGQAVGGPLLWTARGRGEEAYNVITGSAIAPSARNRDGRAKRERYFRP